MLKFIAITAGVIVGAAGVYFLRSTDVDVSQELEAAGVTADAETEVNEASSTAEPVVNE